MRTVIFVLSCDYTGRTTVGSLLLTYSYEEGWKKRLLQECSGSACWWEWMTKYKVLLITKLHLMTLS